MGPENKNEHFTHIPVLLSEALHFLNPYPGAVVVDATLGGGGHAKAVLHKIMPGGTLVGIDFDGNALNAARDRLASFGTSFIPVQGNFSNIQAMLHGLGFTTVDGVLMDLGVSSHQLDCAGRGFCYQKDVFLDMRMGPEIEETAADLLNTLPREELARIFNQYGEEKWASRIASFIDKHRTQKGPVTRSAQLVDIIKNAIPASSRRKGGHPAKRIFQALRIAVNRELENLKMGLEQGIDCLKPGGRIVVIAYHSLEDEMVKKELRRRANPCTCPPKFPVCRCGRSPEVMLITPKIISPGQDEIKANPRARSARLRAAEKLESGKSSNRIGR